MGRDLVFVGLLVLVNLVLAGPVALYARRMRRSTIGWFLAGFFGSAVISICYLLALGSKADPEIGACDFCAEPIRPEATICPHCRSDLRSETADRLLARRRLG